jgi:hypothetical protein
MNEHTGLHCGSITDTGPLLGALWHWQTLAGSASASISEPRVCITDMTRKQLYLKYSLRSDAILVVILLLRVKVVRTDIAPARQEDST